MKSFDKQPELDSLLSELNSLEEFFAERDVTRKIIDIALAQEIESFVSKTFGEIVEKCQEDEVKIQKAIEKTLWPVIQKVFPENPQESKFSHLATELQPKKEQVLITGMRLIPIPGTDQWVQDFTPPKKTATIGTFWHELYEGLSHYLIIEGSAFARTFSIGTEQVVGPPPDC